MHEELSRAVVALDFAINTQWPIALRTEELELDRGMYNAVTGDFRFL
jgi:hypothetical protein